MVETVFVTGVSGFLGSHVALQLLEKGYHVKGAVRPQKISDVKRRYARFADLFEAVPVSDLLTDNLDDCLKGIDAVIHTAGTLPLGIDPATYIDKAVAVTMKVIADAYQAGVRKFITTSSLASIMGNPNHTFTDQDWNPVDESVIPGLSPEVAFPIYAVAKTITERRLWKFVDEHPDFDVTTINPPFLYGPLIDGVSPAPGDYFAISTNLYIAHLLKPDGTWPFFGPYADVRDVAKAHVLAVKAPKSSEPGIGRKRILFASIYDFDFPGTLEMIKTKRPGLKDRLLTVSPPEQPFKKIPFDTNRVQQVLGIGQDDYTSLEDTILGSVDSILRVEKEWAEKGFTAQYPGP